MYDQNDKTAENDWKVAFTSALSTSFGGVLSFVGSIRKNRKRTESTLYDEEGTSEEESDYQCTFDGDDMSVVCKTQDGHHFKVIRNQSDKESKCFRGYRGQSLQKPFSITSENRFQANQLSSTFRGSHFEDFTGLLFYSKIYYYNIILFLCLNV